MFLLVIDKSRYTFRADGNKSNRLLALAMCIVYLLCVLRATSVGRDIEGYKNVYELTKDVRWGDFSYVYFEKGYVLLMKICTKLNFSFQMYLAVIYTIILLPVFIFIKKYSENKLLSLLIFVCYIIFEFDLTGLRQAIAISLELCAFQTLLSNTKQKGIKYVLLTLFAATIHQSALIALVFLPLVYFVKSLRWYIVVITLGTVLGFAVRKDLFGVIALLFGRDSFDTNIGLHIGGNIVFMSLIAIICVYEFYSAERIESQYEALKNPIEIQRDTFLLKVFMFGILLSAFFGDATAARSYMYFSIVAIALIPNMCAKFTSKSKVILEFAFVVFFIVFFYFNTLKANNFDIVPYRFLWEN